MSGGAFSSSIILANLYVEKKYLIFCVRKELGITDVNLSLSFPQLPGSGERKNGSVSSSHCLWSLLSFKTCSYSCMKFLPADNLKPNWWLHVHKDTLVDFFNFYFIILNLI